MLDFPRLVRHEVVEVRHIYLDVVDGVDRQVVRPEEGLQPPLGVLEEVHGDGRRAEQDTSHEPEPNQ